MSEELLIQVWLQSMMKNGGYTFAESDNTLYCDSGIKWNI